MGRTLAFLPAHPRSPQRRSYLALFVALGGTSYAAVNLPAKSVGAKQLRSDAVNSAKIRNRSLLARDFRAGQLPRGPQGLDGIDGADGADGATNVTVRFDSSGGSATGVASCLAGERATGGGFGSTNLNVVRSAPEPSGAGATPTAWSVTASTATYFSVYVVCAAP